MSTRGGDCAYDKTREVDAIEASRLVILEDQIEREERKINKNEK